MRRDNLRVSIGLGLLNNRNDWISVSELSYATGATARQIGAAISQMGEINVVSEHAEWGKKLMLVADDNEARRLWIFLMHWRYHTEDVCKDVYNSIPISGWISLRDLAEENHMMQPDVLQAIEYMTDVSSKGTGKQIMFKRDFRGHVSDDQ